MLNHQQEIKHERVQMQEPRLSPVFFADIEFYDDGGGLVDGLLQRGGLSVIYGPTGCRKTFLALDIAMSVARGEPWRDRDVEIGGCLYLAAEAGKTFQNRVKTRIYISRRSRRWLTFATQTPTSPKSSSSWNRWRREPRRLLHW